MSNKFSEKNLIKSPAQSRKIERRQPESLKRWIPFCFYIPTIIAGLAAAIVNGEYALYLIVPFSIIGWFCWGFFEYTFHRYALHYTGKDGGIRPPGNETHLAHHRNPKHLEREYVPLHEGLPIALAFFLGATFLTGGWQLATFLYAGFMLGYLFYELLDFEAHHGKAKGRIMRYYKKYHLQHHHADENARYGVTSPVFDYLFGTYYLKPKQARKLAKRASETI
jgi:sterol desaturase/sphingolipid hydroxylase (fatty acid hydroxylase superfamily)